MLSRALVSLVLLPFAVVSIAAQAPRITPQGDPSVRADTIYKLAVNPAESPEENAAFLLDDGVVRFDADGRGTRTYRQIVQILRPEGVDGYREHSFSYQPRPTTAPVASRLDPAALPFSVRTTQPVLVICRRPSPNRTRGLIRISCQPSCAPRVSM